jgi:TM2 domain-containing membrane protein YozV
LRFNSASRTQTSTIVHTATPTSLPFIIRDYVLPNPPPNGKSHYYSHLSDWFYDLINDKYTAIITTTTTTSSTGSSTDSDEDRTLSFEVNCVNDENPDPVYTTFPIIGCGNGRCNTEKSSRYCECASGYMTYPTFRKINSVVIPIENRTMCNYIAKSLITSSVLQIFLPGVGNLYIGNIIPGTIQFMLSICFFIIYIINVSILLKIYGIDRILNNPNNTHSNDSIEDDSIEDDSTEDTITGYDYSQQSVVKSSSLFDIIRKRFFQGKKIFNIHYYVRFLTFLMILCYVVAFVWSVIDMNRMINGDLLDSNGAPLYKSARASQLSTAKK